MDAYLALAAFPDVKPGLQALKQQGLKLAILSNGEPKMLEAAAKSAGIRDLLDEIISVEEVNFKTSNRVYWLGTERLKVSNQQLGFVSANNWDGVAAVSAGLRTFWIQRTAAEVPEELGFPGRHHRQGDHRPPGLAARLGRTKARVKVTAAIEAVLLIIAKPRRLASFNRATGCGFAAN